MKDGELQLPAEEPVDMADLIPTSPSFPYTIDLEIENDYGSVEEAGV